MLISTKGRYALRVMIDLAEHQTDGYIPLKEVAHGRIFQRNILKPSSGSLSKQIFSADCGARAADIN